MPGLVWVWIGMSVKTCLLKRSNAKDSCCSCCLSPRSIYFLRVSVVYTTHLMCWGSKDLLKYQGPLSNTSWQVKRAKSHHPHYIFWKQNTTWFNLTSSLLIPSSLKVPNFQWRTPKIAASKLAATVQKVWSSLAEAFPCSVAASWKARRVRSLKTKKQRTMVGTIWSCFGACCCSFTNGASLWFLLLFKKWIAFGLYSLSFPSLLWSLLCFSFQYALLARIRATFDPPFS